MTTTDTIFAPASGHGTAAIAVIRISGPATDAVLRHLTGRELPPPRRAMLRRLFDPGGDELDRALVLRFTAGASYTGEAAAELHCHGGRAVVAAVLKALDAQPGCRLAEPGEFTRRAMMAGRMDLTEVEALGDLLAAETELQRQQAMRALGGALQRQAEAWRTDLLRAAALVEATIDWADEEVPEAVAPEVAALIGRVAQGLRRELALSDGAERLRCGLEVALVGAPNAGKSSLINVLAGREAAIAAPGPGTTRDVLELRYDLAGLPVVFLDMAGLRETDDAVERIGVARARARAEAAALRLFLRTVDAPPVAEEGELWRAGDLRVWTKSDIRSGEGDVAISAQTSEGIAGLLDRIGVVLSERVGGEGLVGHLRQRQALERAARALESARSLADGGDAELVAEALRTAFREMERLLGRIGVEDVLGTVFAMFCLGK